MRAKLRSFDPIVRYGGDEFVCALTGTDPDDARRRFGDIAETLARDHDQATVSIGVTDLRPGDTLEQLVNRGDAEMYEAKLKRR
jgi:diguanylate cyclase (GGDEF)-like protein